MTLPLNETHDSALKSWVDSANDPQTDFPIQNLPFGVFVSQESGTPGIGVAIGDRILDLAACVRSGLLPDLPETLQSACTVPTLNPLMSLGTAPLSSLRLALSRLLRQGAAPHPENLIPMETATLLLPATIGDYTDFYASIFHATTVGKLFRPDNPLLPNYKYVPIAYHGRASSILPSGTPIPRPQGQRKPPDATEPSFEPSRLLDYELEVGAFVGMGNDWGQAIALDDAESHVFGLCLVNDWSARDIQAWEYQPLGPFLSKSFATTVSPWVVTLEALAPFRCPAFSRPDGDPAPLPYLASSTNQENGGFEITLEVFLTSAEMRDRHLEPFRLSQTSFKQMYWTLAQMVTHHTSNGCNLRPGDLLASGTVSGAEPGTQGCLLEITGRGTNPIELPTEEMRSFLADGDQVLLRGYCQREGFARIGFGDCTGIVHTNPEQ